MNITIFGIATNGYGKYVDQWFNSILNQTLKPKEVVLVLGTKHETPPDTIKLLKDNNVKIIYERTNKSLGYLLNIAIDNITTEWALRIDIDDTLMANAIEEIKKKDYCDVVALKFLLNKETKISPIPEYDKLYRWEEFYKESGYHAIKKDFNKTILKYEDHNFPNFPYLFQALSLGMKFGITDNVCITYEKKKHDNVILKSDDAMKEAYSVLDNSAIKYRLKDIILTVIVPVYNNEELITKCLDSIELRDDIEIIIVDDYSTDNSVKKIEEWIEKVNFKNIRFIKNAYNLGAGATVNKGYDLMNGEYALTLCDDDYLLEPLTKIIKQIDGSDLIFYNIQSNSGKIWNGTTLPGSTKLYKKSIIGTTRRIDQNYGGDKIFYNEILKKNPTRKETDIILYYYNYPRENSLMDKWKNKEIELTIFTIAYNGYGQFLENWLDKVKECDPKEIIIVLGKDHNADIKKLKGCKIIHSDSDVMGTLRNEAIKRINTEWLLYFSADDELIPNVIEEINKYREYDAVALKYTEVMNGQETTRQSAIIEDISQWKKTIIPGYIALRHKLLYEDIEIPNYPYLFKMRSQGFKIIQTDNVCAKYIRREESHGFRSKKENRFGENCKIIEKYARFYNDIVISENASKKYLVEAVKEFKYINFYNCKNIIRKETDEEGKLFVGDQFEIDMETFNYLNGNNEKGLITIKVLKEI